MAGNDQTNRWQTIAALAGISIIVVGSIVRLYVELTARRLRC